MSTRIRSAPAVPILTLIGLLIGSLAVTSHNSAVDGLVTGPTRVLAAAEGQRWYRGNLHTHSYWSDGDDFLEMIALWYREQGYQFLCFTDHNTLAKSEKWVDVTKLKGGDKGFVKLKARLPDWVEQREKDGQTEVRLRRFDEVREKFDIPGEFLLIQGEEISDQFQSHPIHMNASNIQELLPPLGGTSAHEVMQNNVDAVIAQRERTGEPILVHLNHPNFGYAIKAEDLMRVRGENFFEVYNGHPSVNNSGNATRASTEQIWDVVNTLRLTELNLPLMYGLAVDDGHEYHNIPSRASEPGRGWVMVLAKELSPRSLIDALERGDFYASSGVILRHIEITSGVMTIEIQAEAGVEYTIDFIGTKRDAPTQGEPIIDTDGKPVNTTHRYSPEIGRVLQTSKGASAIYCFRGDELYVRATITSTRKHPNPGEEGELERAWVQPVQVSRTPAGNR